jgi:hypothetical protein
MSRIEKKIISIDSEKVKNFYENNLFNHFKGDNALKRYIEEKRIILNLVNKYKINISSILDIGSGDGYPAEIFIDNDDVLRYKGFDFSTKGVEIANNKFNKYKQFEFISTDVTKMPPSFFQSNQSSFVVSCGLFPYINDENISELLIFLKSLGKNVFYYFRTSMSKLDHRISLQDFYSDELNADYNVIYRTDSEYKKFFKDCGFEVLEDNFIFSDIKPREDTGIKYYLLKIVN